ncbi:hypothetical protein NL676_022568 [Syzygium grande]|nr:hypothetical protein NL676_022568 [Syzygium grande]
MPPSSSRHPRAAALLGSSTLARPSSPPKLASSAHRRLLPRPTSPSNRRSSNNSPATAPAKPPVASEPPVVRSPELHTGHVLADSPVKPGFHPRAVPPPRSSAFGRWAPPRPSFPLFSRQGSGQHPSHELVAASALPHLRVCLPHAAAIYAATSHRSMLGTSPTSHPRSAPPMALIRLPSAVTSSLLASSHG